MTKSWCIVHAASQNRFRQHTSQSFQLMRDRLGAPSSLFWSLRDFRKGRAEATLHSCVDGMLLPNKSRQPICVAFLCVCFEYSMCFILFCSLFLTL